MEGTLGHGDRPGDDGRLRLVRVPDRRAAVRQGGPVRRPPGPARSAQDRHGAVPGDARGTRLRADRDGPRAVLELLHLLRLAGLRDPLRRDLPAPLQPCHRLPAAQGRLPPPRGAGGHRPSHRGRRARAVGRGQPADPDDGLHLAGAAARQRPALARADRGPAAGARPSTRSRRSSSPTRTSRRTSASSSSTSATAAACTFASRRRRWTS